MYLGARLFGYIISVAAHCRTTAGRQLAPAAVVLIGTRAPSMLIAAECNLRIHYVLTPK